MRLSRPARTPAAAVTVAALLATAVLAGCAPSKGSTAESAGTGPIPVVTSTNVWGDIVREIGRDDVEVTAVISDPAADPHSFEPNAQAQLAISKAELLVENGGGYDDWMTAMVQASGSTAPLINVVEEALLPAPSGSAGSTGSTTGGTGSATAGTGSPAASGSAEASDGHGHGETNEHVWYDLPTVKLAAAAVAARLTELRPDRAQVFAERAGAFDGRLNELIGQVDAIRDTYAGDPIAVTEPVPLYLTEAAGLADKTPERFSAAIEEGTDVPPAVLDETLELFRGKQVVLLVYNEQTSSPETEQVQAAANAAGIPVVAVTESLPADKDYVTWMKDTIAAIAGALG
jgi:zinc/manganese transport system substrate-binding protein